MRNLNYTIDLIDATGTIFTHIVPRAATDRFLRELVTNSSDHGITPADQEAALEEFAIMHAGAERGDNTVNAAAYRLWADGRLGIAWRDGQMLWKYLGDPETA